MVSIQTVAIDFDGDGIDDFMGSPNSIPTRIYNESGIYAARIWVIDITGQTFTHMRTIAVLSVIDSRTRACSAYAHLRARLRAGDTTGALQAFTPSYRFDVKPILDVLGTNSSLFADRLGTIATGLFSPVNAELTLVNEVAGMVRGTSMHVEQCGDGVWRIDSL